MAILAGAGFLVEVVLVSLMPANLWQSGLTSAAMAFLCLAWFWLNPRPKSGRIGW